MFRPFLIRPSSGRKLFVEETVQSILCNVYIAQFPQQRIYELIMA